jgi:hypothetical protein
MSSLPHQQSILGIYTGSLPVKLIFAWKGHCLRSIRSNVVEFTTTYAALGGHFLCGGGHGGGVGGVVCFLPGLEVVRNPMYVTDLKF